MRIHLILRSMWPKRAHVEDVHVGMVELMGLGDEVCPVIPRIEGLLRGVATEMRVSCCLFSTRTPVLHRICFGADLTRRKRRKVDQIPYRVNLRDCFVLLASFCLDSRGLFSGHVLPADPQPNESNLLDARAQALLPTTSDTAASCR